MAITLIDEAVAAGARCHKACEVLGLTERSLGRWSRSASLVDGRKGTLRYSPQTLAAEARATIVELCDQTEYQSLPPSQIVPSSFSQ